MIKLKTVNSILGKIYISLDSQDFIINVSFTNNQKQNDLSDSNNIQDEFNAYFNGKLKNFSLQYKYKGSEFQEKVWNEIQKTPYGQTRSYKEIASAIGHPKAYRAVGTACGQNPLLILIPCHRIIASNGTVGGYAGGLNLKSQLLELEKM